MYSFPENAVWIWENLDSEGIKDLIIYTGEINSKVAGKEEEDEEPTIDVNDPHIKSQLDTVKRKLGIIQ
jgi:hypothetical protein